MLPYSATLIIPKFPLRYCKPKGRGKGNWVCDATITFDTETTTFFLIGGEWKSEKYCTEDEIKNASDALGIVYVWACKMPGLTVYGRTKSELAQFLARLDQTNPMRKIMWVHNLNYDYSFLSDLLEPNPTNEKAVVARGKMAPLKIDLFGYNMELRDSYALCNMSLEKVGESYGLNHKKLKGHMDYTEARLPNTPLTCDELDYLEADVDVLYDYIETEWLPEYQRNWLDLPMTQTGVPRRQVKALLSQDKKHMKHMKAIRPQTVDEYNNLHEPFAGGVAHCNYLYTSDDAKSPEIIKNVTSADRASSYPTEAATRKFPSSAFMKMIDPEKMDIYEEDHVYIALCRFKNLKQKCAWDYISYSKCHEEPVNAVVDNGRIASADEVVIKLTNIDLRIINNVYDYDDCEIIEAYVATADYLPLPFVDYLLTLYSNKTKLKKSNPALYLRSKQLLNALYGMLCTDICKEDIFLENGEWRLEYEDKDEDEIVGLMNQKLYKANPFLPYSVGVFITAYAREQLFDPIIHYDPTLDAMVGIGNEAVYTDTDSVKFINAADNLKYIEDYNERMLARLRKVAAERNIPYERFAPTDPDGNPHPLGVFEADGFYDEFVSMGSKKYCYMCWETNKKTGQKEYNFHFTVAGLQKSYVGEITNPDGTTEIGVIKTMTSMDQMRPGVVIPKGRTNYIYSTSQPQVELTDYLGNKYINDYERGVAMWRTSYTFSLANDYASLLDDDLLTVWASKCFNKISSPLAQVAQWRKDGTNG